MSESHLPPNMTPAQAIMRLVNGGAGPFGVGPIRPITESEAQAMIDEMVGRRFDYVGCVKLGLSIDDLVAGTRTRLRSTTATTEAMVRAGVRCGGR